MTPDGFPVRGGVAGVTVLQSLALLPPFAVSCLAAPGPISGQLSAVFATILLLETMFDAVRERGRSFHGLTTGMIVVLFIPTGLPIWQLVMMLALGVIIGELVFGGRGFGFLNPAVIALSLLVYSFPQVELSSASAAVAIAAIPGTVLLFLFGLISWRIVGGTLLGLTVGLALAGTPVDLVTLASALTLGIIFLICDPVSAAVTNPGRWVYGFLAGALVVLFSTRGDLWSEAVVAAALLASVFAPLIDHLVVLAHARRRRVAHV